MKSLSGLPKCAIGKYPGAAAVALAASQVKQSSSGSHGWLQIKTGFGLNGPSECNSRATTVLIKCQTNSRISSTITYVKISWWPSSLNILRAASPRYFSATFRKQVSNLCSEYLSFQCPLETHPRIEILPKSSFAIVWYCSTHWATDMCSLPSMIAIRPPVLVPATTSNMSLGAMFLSGRSNAIRRSSSWRMRRDDRPRTPPPSACSQLPVSIGQVGLSI